MKLHFLNQQLLMPIFDKAFNHLYHQYREVDLENDDNEVFFKISKKKILNKEGTICKRFLNCILNHSRSSEKEANHCDFTRIGPSVFDFSVR